ncbi:hypothetical protein HOK51_04270 [Candidatus Woesearchaeota archaeon]|jgi:hypothetical protein|nr:hypothetical protein [Candidatus Woesearchaeota archaeon]MBT6519038.1 hypothetical protein [Candidatus Woesearchaeota archaeon]MBT7368763.1 hypothetical protein [Candidatus Woesearchaeota archaeon]
MKSTTSKLGIGIIALAMLGGSSGCSGDYSVCDLEQNHCTQYSESEFIKTFKFEPKNNRQPDGLTNKICLSSGMGKYCNKFTRSDIEHIQQEFQSLTIKPNKTDHYVVCFEENDCDLLWGWTIWKVLSEFGDGDSKSDKKESTEQEKPVENSDSNQKIEEKKPVEEKTESLPKPKLVFAQEEVITFEGTIVDVQYSGIGLRDPLEEKLVGLLPAKYVFVKGHLETKVFVYISNNPVHKSTAKINYKEFTDHQIIARTLVTLETNNNKIYPHRPAETIHAEGLIDKIEYKF